MSLSSSGIDIARYPLWFAGIGDHPRADLFFSVGTAFRSIRIDVSYLSSTMAAIDMQHTKGFNDPATSNLMVDERVRVDATGLATGTDNDGLDMARMGRSQELRRNFKSLSVLGLAITTMSTWMGMLFGNVFSLTNGGLGGTIWIYFISWLCTFALAASLAEMASMAPTSGGQYRESGDLLYFTRLESC